MQDARLAARKHVESGRTRRSAYENSLLRITRIISARALDPALKGRAFGAQEGKTEAQQRRLRRREPRRVLD